MKKFFEWFGKDNSFLAKVLPCCWAVALFLGGAGLFQDGITLDAVLQFLLRLFCGLLFWAIFVALPWALQKNKNPDGTPRFTNGWMLFAEVVILVGLTVWAGGYA